MKLRVMNGPRRGDLIEVDAIKRPYIVLPDVQLRSLTDAARFRTTVYKVEYLVDQWGDKHLVLATNGWRGQCPFCDRHLPNLIPEGV